MTDIKNMSKEQMAARIQELEARAPVAEPGRIWPDVSKATKEGTGQPGPIVFRGANANPRFTLNMYPSQFARFVAQLPSIVSGVLDPKVWEKVAFRSKEERVEVKSILEGYIKKGSSKA